MMEPIPEPEILHYLFILVKAWCRFQPQNCWQMMLVPLLMEPLRQMWWIFNADDRSGQDEHKGLHLISYPLYSLSLISCTFSQMIRFGLICWDSAHRTQLQYLNFSHVLNAPNSEQLIKESSQHTRRSHTEAETNTKPPLYHLIRRSNSNVKSSSFPSLDINRAIKDDLIRHINLVRPNALVRKGSSFVLPGGGAATWLDKQDRRTGK